MATEQPIRRNASQEQPAGCTIPRRMRSHIRRNATEEQVTAAAGTSTPTATHECRTPVNRSEAYSRAVESHRVASTTDATEQQIQDSRTYAGPIPKFPRKLRSPIRGQQARLSTTASVASEQQTNTSRTAAEPSNPTKRHKKLPVKRNEQSQVILSAPELATNSSQVEKDLLVIPTAPSTAMNGDV